MTEATVICAYCSTRVSIIEMDMDGRCDVCREHKARAGRAGYDEEGQMLGGDASVFLGDLEPKAGEILSTCDEE